MSNAKTTGRTKIATIKDKIQIKMDFIFSACDKLFRTMDLPVGHGAGAFLTVIRLGGGYLSRDIYCF